MNTKRYTDLFRAEARDRLAEMNTSLLAIERGEGIERVAELFRAVHTVKGMSAAMGYTSVRDVSHALEALLELMRRQAIAMTEVVIDVLFEAVDALEAAIIAVSADETAATDVAAIVARLERIAAQTPEAELDLAEMQTMEWPAMQVSATTFAVQQKAVATPVASPPTAKAEKLAVSQRSALSPFPSAGSVEKTQRSIRVDAERLDTLMTLIGELVIARGRLQEVARKAANPAFSEAVLHASKLIGSLQTEITTARMVPVGQAFERFERLVRDTANSLGKKVVFEILGSDIEVDKSVLDEIGEPVMHLLRNSLDHGVETPQERRAAGKPPIARLTLSATRERSSVVIRVSDDGRGVNVASVLERARHSGLVDADWAPAGDSEILALIARPGFSTTARVTEISGRGVGLDVVATKVRSLGGAMEMSTDAGAGTEIRLELPMTLAIIHAVLARSNDEIYALPITHVVETLMVSPDMVRFEDGQEILEIRGVSMPAVRLRDRLGHPPRNDSGGHAVVLDLPDGRMTLVVDEFLGQQEIVVKQFDAARGMPKMFNGATILTNGSPALILDAQGIA
ncbi:MAG TPA: chemotaxis protein CheA [Gemmatimonadaceae bacterium]|nr:chemotaxis protein CheA [Gemmatimonadaceae bacterium]